jgi:hypothetical protein
MPSIALFIKELLAEEKYGSEFTDRIEERINVLNAAQLQGIYNHLAKTAKESKGPLWKEANMNIMSKIEGALRARLAEVEKEKKLIEEYRIKQRQKRTQKRNAEREKIRVMEMIEEKAHQQAEQEILEYENKRQAAERVYIMQETIKAEEKRNLYWKIIVIVFLLLVGGSAYVMKDNILFLIAIIFGLAIISIYCGYRAHLLTFIKPIQIAPEYIENQIQSREELLKKQALSQIRERERKFKDQQRFETLERRRLRKERREKAERDATILEEARLEKVKKAKELLQADERSQLDSKVREFDDLSDLENGTLLTLQTVDNSTSKTSSNGSRNSRQQQQLQQQQNSGKKYELKSQVEGEEGEEVDDGDDRGHFEPDLEDIEDIEDLDDISSVGLDDDLDDPFPPGDDAALVPAEDTTGEIEVKLAMGTMKNASPRPSSYDNSLENKASADNRYTADDGSGENEADNHSQATASTMKKVRFG